MARFGRLIWAAFIVAVGVASFAIYRHYVLRASGDGYFDSLAWRLTSL